MYQKHAHCSYCGQAFAAGQTWPRTCERCRQISYLNPLPVSVVLQPVGGGLLVVRRGIEPGRGKLALPGGFIDVGETWQQAGAREVYEETGLSIDPREIDVFRVCSSETGDGILVIFGLARPRAARDLPCFTPNDEATECLVLPAAQELAFPLHTRVVAEYFARRS